MSVLYRYLFVFLVISVGMLKHLCYFHVLYILTQYVLEFLMDSIIYLSLQVTKSKQILDFRQGKLLK